MTKSNPLHLDVMEVCVQHGQAARICHLSQTTIIRLFDAGVIQGYYVPTGRTRRMPNEKPKRFLDEHALPNPFAKMADTTESIATERTSMTKPKMIHLQSRTKFPNTSFPKNIGQEI